jgi:threonine dehydrogenase-like Zn-dependent dehydrogenase
MHGLHLSRKTLTLRDDLPVPVPAEGEALVRVCLAGICSTDLELVHGYYPFDGILGHEFIGVVEDCNEPGWTGRRVVATINLSPDCGGRCGRRCPEHCPQRSVVGIVGRDGVFAEQVALPVANLLRVPDSLNDEQAVFTEPLAAALRIAEQMKRTEGKAIVIGAGRLGLLCAQALRARGTKVTVIGRSARSLELSKRLGFLTHCADDRDADNLTGAPLIIECSASPEGLRLAVDLCAPEGTIILKSTYADNPGDAVRFAGFAGVLAKVVVDEIRIQGSRCGPFDQALALLESGAIDTASLVDAVYPLAEGLVAMEHAARAGARKILLQP